MVIASPFVFGLACIPSCLTTANRSPFDNFSNRFNSGQATVSWLRIGIVCFKVVNKPNRVLSLKRAIGITEVCVQPACDAVVAVVEILGLDEERVASQGAYTKGPRICQRHRRESIVIESYSCCLGRIDQEKVADAMFNFYSIGPVCNYQRSKFRLSEKEANAARDDVSVEIPDEDLDERIANRRAHRRRENANRDEGFDGR